MPHKSNGQNHPSGVSASRVEFARPAESREPAKVEVAGTPSAPSPPSRAAGRVVRVGVVGRGNAGKTALFRTLADGPVGDFLPSGLHVDVGDPKEVARLIRESEEMQRALRRSGLPPTLAA